MTIHRCMDTDHTICTNTSLYIQLQYIDSDYKTCIWIQLYYVETWIHGYKYIT